MLRRDRDAVVDHHRLDLAVQHRADDRVLEAADQHRLVDHRVLGAAQAADLVRDLRQFGGRRRGHEHRLEIRPPALAALRRKRQPVRHIRVAIIGCFPFAAVVAIAARQQRAAEPEHQPCHAHGVIFGDLLGQRFHQPVTGIGKEVLQRPHFRQRSLHRGAPAARFAAARFSRPDLRLGVQFAPAIQPCRGGCEEVVQMRCVRDSVCHTACSFKFISFHLSDISSCCPDKPDSMPL